MSKYRLMGLVTAVIVLTGCHHGMINGSRQAPAKTIENAKRSESVERKNYPGMTIKQNQRFQVIESFGASGAWWAQYVGGWDNPCEDGTMTVREKIARLLFCKQEGIGLSCYRYNVGAGSKGVENRIKDPWRSTETFDVGPGQYDFDRDANAVWFLNKAVAYGVPEIIFFANSPPVRLTENKKGHMDDKNKPNLLEENYDDFANYMLDIAAHFINQGVPVKYISPINEPQWAWEKGQEGAHYKTKEIVGILRTFILELEKRKDLKGLKISGPESGEWGGKTREYINAMLADEVIDNHMESIDNHSYWTKLETKEAFRYFMDRFYPDKKLCTSEWCEMVNGRDYTMDSAFNLVEEVFDDLTVLDVISWQLWIAVSRYNYRDGLIYVDEDTQSLSPAKRLWAYGNFTKFVRPGFTRIGVSTPYADLLDLKSIAFENDSQIVIVVINRGEEKEFVLDFEQAAVIKRVKIYETSAERDLVPIMDKEYAKETVIKINPASVNTIVLEKQTQSALLFGQNRKTMNHKAMNNE